MYKIFYEFFDRKCEFHQFPKLLDILTFKALKKDTEIKGISGSRFGENTLRTP